MVGLIILTANALFTWVDRTPYTETTAYQQTQSALDRYYEYRPQKGKDSLELGWSSVSLLPTQSVETLPLAGYGARNPKTATGINDSVSVKTLVITNGSQKIAFVSAELLIIHPEIAERVYKSLQNEGWSTEQIYFGATHSHASLGAWAPGIVGDLFAGTYDPSIADQLSAKIAQSILSAEAAKSKGGFSFMELESPDFIRNRLTGSKGKVDPYLKALIVETENGAGIDISYGAHATCLGHTWNKISGDYPAVLMKNIKKDTRFHFVNFRAGAVASMGAGRNGTQEMDKVNWMADGLQADLEMAMQLTLKLFFTSNLEAYKLPLYLEPPQLKVSKNLRVRPWLFRQVVGEYPVNIAVAAMDSLLMVGLPCDFSGELALSLYEYARTKNLTLIINSFNGGYIGYVPDDRWYELNKYETRTMAWYGHDMGAYLSDIIRQVIDHHSL